MNSLRPEIPEQHGCLVSWKEIAAFLNRAERTVKRWERERGLPVHRVPGGERGGVFAYPAELTAWLNGDQGKAAQDGASRNKERSTRRNGGADRSIQLPHEMHTPAASRIGSRGWLARSAVLVLTIGLTGTTLFTARLDKVRTPAVSPDPPLSHHSPPADAERLYLEGRYLWSLRTADSLAQSIKSFAKAITLDPAYAQAYAALAESYDLLPQYGHMSREEAFGHARAAADKAIELDPNLAAGHRARAFALFYGDWDIPGSDAEFRHALALAPNEVETHHWYATTLFSRQEGQESIDQINDALRLNPTNPAIIADAAFIRIGFGENREANLKVLRELSRTQPTLVKSSRYLATFDLDDGRYADDLADLRQAAAISHDPNEAALAAAAERGWHRSGKQGLMKALVRKEQADFELGDSTGFALASLYLQMGNATEALKYFNAAFDRNDYSLMTLSHCGCVAGLHNDPGYTLLFRRVHERMGHSSATFANQAASVASNLPLKP